MARKMQEKIFPTCHDDVEDAGLLLSSHLVGGLAHKGPIVHGSEGCVAEGAGLFPNERWRGMEERGGR
jgi:hypothetical protein